MWCQMSEWVSWRERCGSQLDRYRYRYRYRYRIPNFKFELLAGSIVWLRLLLCNWLHRQNIPVPTGISMLYLGWWWFFVFVFDRITHVLDWIGLDISRFRYLILILRDRNHDRKLQMVSNGFKSSRKEKKRKNYINLNLPYMQQLEKNYPYS